MMIWMSRDGSKSANWNFPENSRVGNGPASRPRERFFRGTPGIETGSLVRATWLLARTRRGECESR